MKKTSLVIAAIAVSSVLFTSCKKDYTCTCTIISLGASTVHPHELADQTAAQAREACERFEKDGNSISPGSTSCDL